MKLLNRLHDITYLLERGVLQKSGASDRSSSHELKSPI
jgi:hypothetical protein